MSMDIFDKVLENIDEKYPFFIVPQTHFGFIGGNWFVLYSLWNHIHMV